jgi:hypothetical protein
MGSRLEQSRAQKALRCPNRERRSRQKLESSGQQRREKIAEADGEEGAYAISRSERATTRKNGEKRIQMINGFLCLPCAASAKLARGGPRGIKT